ncbi:MAG: NAD(P)H-dependent oxidoreductase subunit E [Spirochaetes bacterium]|nr:MAG: NAD(P)H-dependent oxidoreductase subunit E [Spirochaetota bacterium]
MDEKVQAIVKKFENGKISLIGVMQDISEELGYLPEELLREISVEMEVPLSQLYSLATFYNSFRLEPLGEHHVCVCMGTACHVKGSPRIAETLERELGITAGQTSSDQKFTLETVNCLGACALAPLVTIDGEYYGKSDQNKVKKLIEKYK